MLTQALWAFMVVAGSGAADTGGRVAQWGRERVAEVRQLVDGAVPEARYAAAEREVTNWRLQTAAALEPRPVAALAALVDADRPIVSRCVKLNNYWCIKSARWNGEIGTDDEGHVGFASAERGADAAATLLRRYYLEFGRRSALDIVRRWAPAECHVSAVGGASGGDITLGTLAVRGIANTVRARYLASRRKGRAAARAPKPVRVAGSTVPTAGSTASDADARPAAPAVKVPVPAPRPPAPRPAAPRASTVVPPAPPSFHLPPIAAEGGGRRGLTISSSLPYRVTPPRRAAAPRPAPVRTAAAQSPAAPTAAAPAPAPGPAPPPQLTCASDEQRLRNYAGRIVEPLGLGPNDDLKLFAADGAPMPNLAPVLLAMSAVELGTLRASIDLVDGAVERQASRARALAQAEAAEAER